jgi:hypothetical protein
VGGVERREERLGGGEGGGGEALFAIKPLEAMKGDNKWQQLFKNGLL